MQPASPDLDGIATDEDKAGQDRYTDDENVEDKRKLTLDPDPDEYVSGASLLCRSYAQIECDGQSSSR